MVLAERLLEIKEPTAVCPQAVKCGLKWSRQREVYTDMQAEIRAVVLGDMRTLSGG